MTNWRALAAQLDRMVDEQWAETVELHPMLEGGVSTDQSPDPARAIITAQAVLMSPGASVTGEAGTAHGYGGDMRQLEREVWICISEAEVGDIKNWRKGDRVYWPHYDEWYEINWVGPSTTMRPEIHLLRVQDVDR
jgi:hypothetical protein